MTETSQELTAFKVAGYCYFAENNWKQALVFFLDVIWSEKPKIMQNPIFYFATLDVNLCLNKKTRVYYLDCPPGESRVIYPRPIFPKRKFVCALINSWMWKNP